MTCRNTLRCIIRAFMCRVCAIISFTGITGCCISQWPSQWRWAPKPLNRFWRNSNLRTAISRPPTRQNFISVRLRGWSRRIPSLPLGICIFKSSLNGLKQDWIICWTFTAMWFAQSLNMPARYGTLAWQWLKPRRWSICRREQWTLCFLAALVILRVWSLLVWTHWQLDANAW